MNKLANSFLTHLRQSEIRLAKSVLRWKLQKEGRPPAEDAELEAVASHLLDQAREIASKTGKNLYDILKEEAREFFGSKNK